MGNQAHRPEAAADPHEGAGPGGGNYQPAADRLKAGVPLGGGPWGYRHLPCCGDPAAARCNPRAAGQSDGGADQDRHGVPGGGVAAGPHASLYRLPPGELMALRYEDIDRKAGTISIRRKVNYAYYPPRIEEHTKTEAGMRKIPLLAPVRRALPTNRLGLIFHGDGGSPLYPHQLEAEWDSFLQGTGLKGPNGEKITPHWLRHTFATICYDADVDVKSTSSFLGHADEKITMQIYTHLSKSREAASAEKLEEYVKKETAEG